MNTQEKIAVVTGANRGIGFEVCRQLAKLGILVVLTSRDEKKGLEACKKLEQQELTVRYFQLDVTHAASVSRLVSFLQKEFGRCDILVNNAGVFLDKNGPEDIDFPSIFSARIDVIRQTLETNVYGPILLCQALIPLMKKNNYGRVVNISSGMGQLCDMNGGYPGYRISKAAINCVTRILTDELLTFSLLNRMPNLQMPLELEAEDLAGSKKRSIKGNNILVNSVCPGWVKTDMGGSGATRTVQEGADTIVWLATLPNGGPGGKFFRDRKEIPW